MSLDDIITAEQAANNENPHNGTDMVEELNKISTLIETVSETSNRNVAYYSLSHIPEGYAKNGGQQFQFAEDINRELSLKGFKVSYMRDENHDMELEISW